MPGAVTLDNRTIVLPPGQDVTLHVRIRNLGQVVDGFMVDVLGQPGAWAQVNPPETRLFPDTEGAVEIKFRQPENAPPVAGSHPFAVRIRSREDPDWVSIEEGTVEIGAQVEIGVELRPRTSTGRSSGKHQVIVDNLGNTPVWVQVVGDDPDDLFRFSVDPPDVSLAPRTAAIVDLKARLAGRPPTGTTRVPFVVSVLADGRPAATAEGGFSPRKFPWKPVLVLAVALIGLAIAAYVFTRANAETQAREGEDTVVSTTTTTVPGETTTTGGGETTTTEGGGGNGGGPLGQRLDQPQVLFASDRDGDFDLFIANLDGSEAVPITDNGDFDGEPAFSPDGTEVVFVRTTDDNADLFRLDLAGCDPAEPDTCEPERLTATEEDERFPDFSPDGETVVFSRDTADPSSVETDLDLFAIDLDSGDESQLTSQPGDESRPQFSPDGSLVAFDGVFRGGVGIATVDLQGGTPQPLTVGRSVGSTAPQWVDEDTLIYVRPAGEAGELVELDFLTSDPERVLFDEPALVLTAISKDGDRIVFQSEADLFVSDRDGDDADRITDGQGFNFEADLFEPE
jgi:Tol biopolymer transport system component